MTCLSRFTQHIGAAASGLMMAALLTLPTPLMAQDDDVHPGQAVFSNYCAGCHDGGDPRAASTQALQAMTADSLRFALTAGLMQAQGQGLSARQREAVIDYLAVPPVSGEWLTANLCAASERTIDLATVSLASAGGDLRFSRNLSAGQSGLSKADMSTLEVDRKSVV